MGANVTIPHKQAALALADSASDAAREIGAANTFVFGEDGAIEAHNTDARGFLVALEQSLSEDGTGPANVRGSSALVLGAGGSARAVVWGLRTAGAREVMVWNRTAERAQELSRGARRARRQRP